ncbi:MAG: 5'-nucleotidase [Bacteroidaceae bacterium]|nr:5'-nucleotidase [Bacteroidaceae bacterium]
MVLYNVIRKREVQTMNNTLTIGISSRALFDLSKEHEIFINEGTKAYVDFQIAHEKDILPKGPAFGLVQSLLSLNKGDEAVAEVIIMSQNSADAALRIFNSIEAYGLDIKRAALTTGKSIAPYLKAYGVDLYLSADEEDVNQSIDAGVAAGIIMGTSSEDVTDGQIRIAFDGDCVLFSDEAERIFQTEGIEAFGTHEKEYACMPLAKGPFANFLSSISMLQSLYPDVECAPIRTALITARMAPAHERVIRTLRAWNVRIDEMHFLGGREKAAVVKAFGAHIFFDDSLENTTLASTVVLSARVPSYLKVV